MPLGDFIPYIADILAGCGGTVYLQKRSDSAYGAAKAGSNDLRNLTDLRQSLKFFISLESPQESELPAKVFYDDMYRSIIEGTGGAETQEAIEMIALRLVAKKFGRGYLGKFSPRSKINWETMKRSVAGLAATLIFTKIIFTRSAAWTVKF